MGEQLNLLPVYRRAVKFVEPLEAVRKNLEDQKKIETRKADHIELALKSQVLQAQNDKRFYYEPLLSAHLDRLPEQAFLEKK